jgi:hypothetical protein
VADPYSVANAVVLGGLGAMAAVALARPFAKARRRRTFEFVARQLGLDYAAHDILGVAALPFALLRRGDGSRIDNLLYGRWHGVDVVAFDFCYWEERDDSWPSRGAERRYQCAVVPIDASCWPVSIHPENVLTRAAGEAGFHDIEFESDEFNRAFHVVASEAKFANDLIDARMMRWLLDEGRGFSFEARSTWLLVYARRLTGYGMLGPIARAVGFLEHVPRVVYTLYGANTQSLRLGGQPLPD